MDQELEKKVESIRRDYITSTIDIKQENALLYHKIRDLVKSIFKDENVDVDHLFTEGEIRTRKMNSRITLAVQAALLISITAFMVIEAVAFYSDGNPSGYSYFKAILTECCFIFMSAYRSDDFPEKYIAPIVRALLFTLMIYVISSGVITNFTMNSNNATVVDRRAEILESQIKDKQKTIDFYISKGWGNTTNRLVKEKDDLLRQLEKVQTDQQSGSTLTVMEAQKVKTYGNIAFRTLMLLVSYLISRRLFQWRK